MQPLQTLPQLRPTHLIRPPSSTLLRERHVIEIVHLYLQVSHDVVADQLDPLELLGGEASAGGLLLGEPGLEPLIDAVLEGDQLLVRVESETDEGDDVGEELAASGAADLVAGEDLVSSPE